MERDVDIADLIHKGGVYQDIEGNTPEEVYKKICTMIPLPENIAPDVVLTALCAREKVLSTAVGNGIALPHARSPIMKSEDNQRICVVYLKTPLDMNAPDGRKVYVMFVLLTYNSQTHLKIIANLVTLFRRAQFRKLLESHANEAELLNAIRELD
jgi:nitrogen PTS system EIIA component